MVPCPWALHAMHQLRQRPEIPFGVHLTLVCDTTHYRWGPLTAREKVPSLLTGTGELCTPAQIPELLARARLDEVELEFRAQIDAVLDAGLAPTHLDWHCLADGGRDDILDLTVALAGNTAWRCGSGSSRPAGRCGNAACRSSITSLWTASSWTSTAKRPDTRSCSATCRSV